MAATNAKNWRLYPIGYLVVFFVSLISKMLASNVTLHKASIGDSIWAIIIGCILRNLLSINKVSIALPHWLKVAQQTEFYIATSLVLLCIDISVLRPLAPRALFVSWIDTPLLFMVLAFIGWRFLRIDLQTAIIMSGATFICGSSAAIALGASMGSPQKTELPIAIISIFTIPSIIALPYVAKDLGFSATVSGAWFGGCVDSTGAVLASASIYGDKEAVDTSAVVKMMQNVLIGPLSVLMAWAWSHHELRMAYRANEEEMMHAITDTASNESTIDNTDGPHGPHEPENEGCATIPQPRMAPIARRDKAWVLLWKRFPKFVLGFILTAILFNTTVDGDPQLRSNVNTFCFYVSEWFSTLSFVSIGLGLHLDDVRQNIRNLGKLCTLYIMAQMVDIVVTGVLAWTAFTYL
ncbi:hypothetical protein J3Q64DRAFT_1807409 [Phycomyces blakesleeanus]